MTDCVTAEDILRDNDQISRDDLEEMQEALRRLRKQGTRRKDYDLLPPFGGRRITVVDDARTDPRPLRVKRPNAPE